MVWHGMIKRKPLVPIRRPLNPASVRYPRQHLVWCAGGILAATHKWWKGFLMMLLLMALMLMMEYYHDNDMSGPGYSTFKVGTCKMITMRNNYKDLNPCINIENQVTAYNEAEWAELLHNINDLYVNIVKTAKQQKRQLGKL